MATVLLIEDEADIREFVRTALELDGHVVHEAANGSEGVALADAHAGDDAIVMLDVQMPELDGWAMLDHVRSQPGGDRVPVIMCTVRAGADDRARGVAAGADAYLPKPFDLFRLSELVARLASIDRDALVTLRTAQSEHCPSDTTHDE